MRWRLLIGIAVGLGCGQSPTPPPNRPDSGCDLGATETYHGGPVIPAVEVTTVYWGDAVASLRDQIDDFLGAVTQSPFVDWLSEYDTASTAIGRGSFAHRITLTNVATPDGGAIADEQIVSELMQLVDANTVTASASGLLFVFMPPGVAIDGPHGVASIGHFAGYHSSFDSESAAAEFYYAVIPDPTDGAMEEGLSPLDFTTIVASHELAEAITDPSAFNGAWYDPVLGEIGDVCAWKFPPGFIGGYEVQRCWSQHDLGCIYEPGPLDLKNCGATCVDAQSDSANCGACGAACSPTRTCASGVCQ